MKKKRERIYRTLIAAGVLGMAAPAAADDPAVCKELKIRGALPNFQQKLKTQKEITVAYLGGSITEARGWRVKTTRWLQETYPDQTITEINGAISGTGAGFGACRLHEHVLKHKPDLLFVEYRVNGGDNSMARTAEGIVRQTRRLLPETDIVFIYTLSSPMLGEIQHRKSPGESGLGLEQVASHYNIPSIDFGPQIVDLMEDGSLLFKGESAPEDIVLFSTDGVHPGDAGHSIYFEVLKRSFTRILDTPATAAPHLLAAPLDPNNWEQGAMYDPEPYLAEGGDWEMQAWSNSPVISAFQKIWPEIECERMVPMLAATSVPGSALEFTFKGTVFGFFDLGGPETGNVRITLDGGEAFDVPRFINYCSRYRPQYYLSEELPFGLHTVRIELTEPKLDKRSIVGDAVYESKPRFMENRFYPVKILLNGKMVDKGKKKESEGQKNR